jgi:hypothetical protein
LGVSRQGEFKNTTKLFLQKVHVGNYFQKIYKNFDVSFSSTFLFYRVFGCFSRWEFKNTPKSFATNIVSKSFYKTFDQKSKTDFFSIFFNHVFGRFSVRGVQKHDKKISHKNLTTSLFRTPTHPPTTGVTAFFFAGPLLDAVGHRTAGST